MKRDTKPFDLVDACLGLDMSEEEEALWRSRQGIAARLGIKPSDVLFYLSSRNLTRQNKRAVSVRRASDSKTSVVPFRPPVAYDAPRNMLHYDPVTWAEWVLTNATGDANGVVLTAGGAIRSNVRLNGTILKPSTKYGMILNITQNNMVGTGTVVPEIAGTLLSSDNLIGAGTGQKKYTLTTGSTIANNRCGITDQNFNTSGTITIRDIRVFELPTGSQIEADFTNLSADALAAKYPMCGANGAAIGAAPGVAKDRVCNAFANGDGRYGTVGWGWYQSTISSIPNGVRATGDGTGATAFARTTLGRFSFPVVAGRKIFVKAKIKAPVEIGNMTFGTWNGVGGQSLSVTSQLTPGVSGWVRGVVPAQTEAGNQGGAQLDWLFQYADAATANGKAGDVEFTTIAIMGDSAADPHYNDDAATFDAYLRTQPGVVLLPDGEYYVPPYGLCPGEQDLDVTAAFGGTSQLYDTYAGSQGKRVLGLNQVVTNGDFHDGTTGWEVQNGNISASGGIANAVGLGNGTDLNATIYTGAHSVPGNKYGFSARMRVTNSECSAIKIRLYNGTEVLFADERSSPVSNQWYTLCGTVSFTTTGEIRADAYSLYSSDSQQNGKVLEVDYVEAYDLTAIFGKGLEPTAAEFAAILAADGNQYWEGTRDVDCSSAYNAEQSTAASQPKIWDNGLSYSGLGLFDGSDDYMAADLPDITTGPATWWAKLNNADVSSYRVLFARNGASLAEGQYTLIYDPSVKKWWLELNGGGTFAADDAGNRDVLIAFSWNGTTITTYSKINGVVTAGTPVAFTGPLTSRANKFIGCRSNAADGSARAAFFKGTPQEIGITKTTLTPAQIAKL